MRLEIDNFCCDRRPGSLGELGQKAVTSPPARGDAKTRILFVDDEPAMLRVLQMGMRPMTTAWDMEFVESGEDALARIQQCPFDVVVTDMRMSGMNGAQLLNHILRTHPQTVRIVLSGYSDLNEVVSCVGLTHQFLQKPCGLDELKICLARVAQVNDRLSCGKLRMLAASLRNLPSLPELYLDLAEALQSPNSTSERIAEVACQDPAIAAKLLQLSNSAYFGFSRKVASVTEAVQLLGAGVIQSLAMAAPIFSAFSRQKCPLFPIDQVWEHSLQTAMLARHISTDYLGDASLAEQAFCAGLLHDLGKVILADGLPDDYGTALAEQRQTGASLFEIERSLLGATHAEVGGYLLAIWGIPIPLVEAVANHHHPGRCGSRELCLAGMVHIANALQHASAQGQMPAGLLDTDYLKFVGLESQFETWRAAAGVEGQRSE